MEVRSIEMFLAGNMFSTLILQEEYENTAEITQKYL
jgi:hypothetical protein